MVRNRVVLGHWIFVRSNFGAEFALGNHHLSRGRGEGNDRHPTTSAAELQAYQRMGEYAYVREKHQEAMEFVRQYPGEFLALTAKRVLYFWDGSAGNIVLRSLGTGCPGALARYPCSCCPLSGPPIVRRCMRYGCFLGRSYFTRRLTTWCSAPCAIAMRLSPFYCFCWRMRRSSWLAGYDPSAWRPRCGLAG